MKATNNVFSLLTEEHAGKWVAVSSDYKKVLGYSTSLEALEKKITDKDAIYTKGLSKEVFYCF